MSKFPEWVNGIQQGSGPNTGTRIRNFFAEENTYEINIGNQFFEYNNFDGRSGSKKNPWLFHIHKFNSKTNLKQLTPDNDIFLSMNRVVKNIPDSYGAGLCRVCMSITEY